MKIFEEQGSRIGLGQEAQDFPANNNLSLSGLRGHPIFLVFWKTL
jgi:hypothetical protein